MLKAGYSWRSNNIIRKRIPRIYNTIAEKRYLLEIIHSIKQRFTMFEVGADDMPTTVAQHVTTP